MRLLPIRRLQRKKNKKKKKVYILCPGNSVISRFGDRVGGIHKHLRNKSHEDKNKPQGIYVINAKDNDLII